MTVTGQNNLLRRAIRRPLVAAAALAAVAFVGLGPQSASAGVMIPWAQENAAVVDQSVATVDPCLDGCMSSIPVEEQDEPAIPVDENRRAIEAFGGFAESTGGASAPTNSSSGATASVPAAILEMSQVGLIGCSYAQMRELDPQLPAAFGRGIFRPPRVNLV